VVLSITLPYPPYCFSRQTAAAAVASLQAKYEKMVPPLMSQI